MTTQIDSFGILGYGYVGRATHLGILKNQQITVHDTVLQTSIDQLYQKKYVFICIPTTTYADIGILIDQIKLIKSNSPETTIIIRSTLPIGTCDFIRQSLQIGVIYIPEFLRERFWEEDCQKRPLIVGHYGVDLPQWLINESILECSPIEAETVKMFSNSYAVMRIAFANLFYDLSQKIDADYDKIKNMFFSVAHDQTYMQVPGHDGTRGFGGKCLPKDLNFIIDTLDEHKIDSSWPKIIRELNKTWQEKF